MCCIYRERPVREVLPRRWNERLNKPFQTILSNHNIFTALSVCLAQTDAIWRSLSRHHLCRYNFYFLNLFIFFLARYAFDTFEKRRKEEGSSRLTVHLILPNSDDANPPIRVYIYLSFEWQPQNLIVHTSVCKFLFSLSPPLSLHNARLECNAVCYSTMQHCCSRQHTHTRYGSQFVSSPSPALLSALSKECRVLFIQTIQSCVHIYLYSIHICIFFPLFFHFDIFVFFFFVWACCSD